VGMDGHLNGCKKSMVDNRHIFLLQFGCL